MNWTPYYFGMSDPNKAKKRKIVQYSATLFWCWTGWSISLHKFVKVDRKEPLHTHQATTGFRIILWGGYVEETIDARGVIRHRTWLPGMIGHIPHHLCHRLTKILGKQCFTLWIRGFTRHAVTYKNRDNSVHSVLTVDQML